MRPTPDNLYLLQVAAKYGLEKHVQCLLKYPGKPMKYTQML